MIALTSPYLWYSTRATGMVTLVLFTLVVTLGTFVANRVGGNYVGRFEINELHRSLSMVAVVFLAIHVTTTVVDSYVPTGVLSVVVPFTSAYRRVAVGVGAVALDLIAAVWISSLLKTRVANTTWRFIHWFSWLALATALVHAYLTGTDARHGWGLVVVGGCAAAGVAAALWRVLGRPARAAGRTALSPPAQGPRSPSHDTARPTSRPLGSRPPQPSPPTGTRRAPARHTSRRAPR